MTSTGAAHPVNALLRRGPLPFYGASAMAFT